MQALRSAKFNSIRHNPTSRSQLLSPVSRTQTLIPSLSPKIRVPRLSSLLKVQPYAHRYIPHSPVHPVFWHIIAQAQVEEYSQSPDYVYVRLHFNLHHVGLHWPQLGCLICPHLLSLSITVSCVNRLSFTPSPHFLLAIPIACADRPGVLLSHRYPECEKLLNPPCRPQRAHLFSNLLLQLYLLSLERELGTG